ncbi:reverse transcriptase family protein [Vibrio campbellii]|uniref:reverse transcriptase family protein n=1 Tax=Vibrio campbellii TaxID=680 RepID=UPI0006804949|nr:reverse transcriptase family protein [Vibrio campbellii]
MKKSKLKITTKGKEYTVKDSPFYNLRTKRHLATLLNCSNSDLRKYAKDEGNYHEFDEKGANCKIRKIQQPTKGLDKVHTRIASLLCRMKTPDYLHSGKKKHSNVSNAIAHNAANNSQTPLMTTDVKSFFPSTSRRMIFSFFFSVMKCSADVADILADICTIHGFLPTGSRISMPLAFWANSRMFSELERLSTNHGNLMTVYVDDLTFSGVNVNPLFKTTVKKIIHRHGHVMHPDKTKIYGSNDAKLVTGVVIKGGKLMVRNEQRKQLVNDLSCWSVIKNQPDAINNTFTQRLIGRLHSMGVVDESFKKRAITVRSQTTR